MSLKSVHHAISQIESNLLKDEKILWLGHADRRALEHRFFLICLRHALFYLSMVAGSVAIVWFKPANPLLWLGLIGALTLFHMICCALTWPNETRRRNEAYAVTNKRLMTADGRRAGVTSWFSPKLDRMVMNRRGRLATFRLRDHDMNMDMEFFLAPAPNRVRALLSVMQVDGDVAIANKPADIAMVDVSDTLPALPAAAKTKDDSAHAA